MTIWQVFKGVSIYPKAEKGLRAKMEDISDVLIYCFNLPEGREGFKRFKTRKYMEGNQAKFQSTRRQRRV